MHRIGRTGRAGKEGFAWTLAAGDRDKEFVGNIETLIGEAIEVADVQGGSRLGSGSGSGRSERKGSADKTPRGDSRPRRESKPKAEGKAKPKREPRQRSEPKEKRDQYQDNRSADFSENDNESSGVTGFGEDVPGFFGSS